MNPLYTVTLDREAIAKILADHALALGRREPDDNLVADVKLPIQLTEVAIAIRPKRAPVKLKTKAAE